jgi:hypothetical protein
MKEAAEDYPELDKKTYRKIRIFIWSYIHKKFAFLDDNKKTELYGVAEDAIMKEFKSKQGVPGSEVYGKELKDLPDNVLRNWVYKISFYACGNYYKQHMKAVSVIPVISKDSFEKVILTKLNPKEQEFLKSMYILDGNQYKIRSDPKLNNDERDEVEKLISKSGFRTGIDASKLQVKTSTGENGEELHEPSANVDIQKYVELDDYSRKLIKAFKKLDRKDNTDNDGLSDGEIVLFQLMSDLEGSVTAVANTINKDSSLKQNLFPTSQADPASISYRFNKIKNILKIPENYQYLKSLDLV